jgi:hypothetical protein
MKRRRPDPEALELAREHAKQARIELGLPAEDDSELGRMLEERIYKQRHGDKSLHELAEEQGIVLPVIKPAAEIERPIALSSLKRRAKP